MIRKFQLLIMILTVFVAVRVSAAEKVLLDSDMVDLFDDGVAMMMLAESPDIELMGITTVTGNNWGAASTASTIRQLEGIGVKD